MAANIPNSATIDYTSDPIYRLDLTVAVPVKAVMEDRQSYFGVGANGAVSAIEAGYTQSFEAPVDPAIRFDTEFRRRNGLVHLFRYNQITEQSLSLIAGGSGSSQKSCQSEDIKKELETLQSDTQSKIIGNASPDTWFVRYVEGQVDEHDMEVHLKNLRLQAARLALNVRAGETVGAKESRMEKAAAYASAFKWHLDHIIKTFEAAITSALKIMHCPPSNPPREIPTIGTPANIVGLCRRRNRIASLDPYSSTALATNQTSLLPPPALYFKDLQSDVREYFWKSRWTVDAAVPLYHPFRHVVDVEANFNGEMSQQMLHTWVTVCASMAKDVVVWRKEQERVDAAGPDVAGKFNVAAGGKSSPYDPNLPFKKLQTAQNPSLEGKGIEVVLVPQVAIR